MNSEERAVIDGIFKRLEQASGQPRDAEAERYIADKLRAQPYAPYAMAQLVYVQEEAIKSLNEQLEQTREQAQAPQGGGGFLSSIFGGGQRAQAQPQRPGGAPWANQQGQGGPQQGYGQQGYGQAPGGQQGGPWGGGAPGGFGQQQAPQRSGFLGSALTTAAGVAGGMVVGSALMNAFSGGHSTLGALGGSAQAAGADGGLGGEGSGGLWSGGDAGTSTAGDFGSPLHGGGDAGLQDAGFDNASFDDGGDSGGGDDWV